MNLMIPERLSQARELAGLNKSEIAKEIGVSVAAVTQWENGSKNPTTDNLSTFSRITNIPFEFLMLRIRSEIRAQGQLSFRAHQAAKTNRLRLQAQRFAEVCAELYLWLEDWVDLPKCDLPYIDCPEEDVEAAATACRRHWGLGDRPIMKLGELLESKGIRLCSVDVDDLRVDGFSRSIGGRAFIYLGSYSEDKARSRFNAAHESWLISSSITITLTVSFWSWGKRQSRMRTHLPARF